jgi:hypothetical protein
MAPDVPIPDASKEGPILTSMVEWLDRPDSIGPDCDAGNLSESLPDRSGPQDPAGLEAVDMIAEDELTDEEAILASKHIQAFREYSDEQVAAANELKTLVLAEIPRSLDLLRMAATRLGIQKVASLLEWTYVGPD